MQFGEDCKDNFRFTEAQLEEIMRQLTAGETVEERKKAHQAVFRGMGNDPLKALLLHCLNSGGSRFGQWKHCSKKHDGKELDLDALEKEILGEGLTERELEDMHKRFHERHSHAPEHLLSCSACGCRRFEEKHEELDLFDPRVQKFKCHPVDQLCHESRHNDPESMVVTHTDERTPEEVNAWDIISVCRHSDGTCCHLHPELVSSRPDGVKAVWLCQSCLPDKCETKTNPDGTSEEPSVVIPELSIAGGVDFGCHRRLGLAPLNFHEKTVLSLNRLFVSVLKATVNTSGRVNHNTGSRVRTHAVMFAQNSLEMLDDCFRNETDVLSLENMTRDLLINLIDGKGRCDFLARRLFLSPSLFGRWWQFLSCMRVLKVVNSEFTRLRVPSQLEMQLRCEQAKTKIMSFAERMEDRSSVVMEAQIGSDVAEEERRHVPEEDRLGFDHNAEADVSAEMPIDVTCVFDDPVVKSGGNQKISNRACLMSVSDVAMINRDDVPQNSNKVNLSVADDVASESGSWFGDDEEDDATCRPSLSCTFEDDSSCSSANGACFSPLDESSENGNDKKGEDDLSCSSAGGAESKNKERANGDAQQGAAEEEPIDEGAFLRAMATNAGGLLESTRENIPVNEFTATNLLGKTFPSTFVLGKACGPKRVRLSSRQLNHLLHQFTNVPSEDFRLLGHLQNVIMRHDVMRGVVAHVKTNARAKADMNALLTDGDRQRELHEAIQNPESDLAQKLMNKCFSHLNFSGKDVDTGALESFKLKSMIMESCKRHSSPPSAFVTLSFNNVDNPRTVRSSFHTVNNDVFPAQFDDDCAFGSTAKDFIEFLRENSCLTATHEIQQRTLDRSARAAGQMSNPIACVDETRSLPADVCGILFGMPLEHFFRRDTVSRRKTWCFTCNKGILGHAQAVTGVMEDHARGTLHFHFIFIGGLSPFVLREYANVPRLCSAIVSVLDSQHKASFPQKSMLVRLVQDCVRFRVPPNPDFAKSTCEMLRAENLLSHHTSEESSIEETTTSVAEADVGKQWHNHMCTCTKGKMGKTGCRLCFPAGLCQSTRAVVLHPSKESTSGAAAPNQNAASASACASDRPRHVVEEVGCLQVPPTHNMVDPLHAKSDLTVIAWEIARPQVVPCIALEQENLCVASIKEKFRTCLFPCDEFASWMEFRRWLDGLSDDETVRFCEDMAKQLANANGRMPAFNVQLKCLTGSHNNVVLLGSTEQAAGAVFHICPCMGKKNCRLRRA